jgi:hypothetical protein
MMRAPERRREIMIEESMRDMTNSNDEHFSKYLKWQAHKNEMIARNLSHEAMSQWQKAVNGILAFPAAIALSTAANALFMAAFIERGFEAFQASAEAMGREFQNRAQDYMRANGEWGSSVQGRSAQPQS